MHFLLSFMFLSSFILEVTPSHAAVDSMTSMVVAQQTNQETIDAIVVAIKGQRFQVRLRDGTTRWFTTDASLSQTHVGKRVTGTSVPAGDGYWLLNPVFLLK